MGLIAQESRVPESPGIAPDLSKWKHRAAPLEEPPINLSVSDRGLAEERFEKIEPLTHPERFQDLWRECDGLKGRVERALADRHGVPSRTLRRWAASYKKHGQQGLVNRDRADKGEHRKINKAAAEFILAMAVPKAGAFATLSGREIFRAYEEERAWREQRLMRRLQGADEQKYSRYLGEDGLLLASAALPKISYKTLLACMAEIPEPVLTLARRGEEAYRNTQEIISYRDLTAIEPLEWLVCDHRILDIFCRVPVRGGWRLARPWFSAGIDMRTRRWLGWGIFEVPSSEAIATVLKKVCINFGVPANCYWDNGKDYRSEYLEGNAVLRETGKVGELDASWRGVTGALGIRITHAIVRNARAKIIEPNFVRVANFDKQLPEYCGHRPSERPDRFDAMVKQHEAWIRGDRPESPFRTIQEIAALYDQAIEDINERELQGDGMQKFTPTGRGWMSPAECWDELIGRVERRTVRLEDIHIIFSKRRAVTVKHGEICVTFSGQRFHYRLEGEPTQLMAVNGQLVEFAYDPHDLGQAAIYWRDRFIGLASCAPLRKMGEDGFVEDERNRRAARRDIKAAVVLVHKTIPTLSPEERLARRREVLPARENAKPEILLELPEPIQQAADASRADREFSFTAAAEEAEPIVSYPPPAESDDESTFCFFKDGKL
jgi:transposase